MNLSALLKARLITDLRALLKAHMPVDTAAHQAATSPLNLKKPPTPAQAKAGNYAKGHTSVAGLQITIENPAGTRRKPHQLPMTAHYGYIRGTVGKDGDQVDVFVRPSTDNDWAGDVYVVNQINADDKFDEHKAMIGWTDERSAVRAYLGNYPRGWKLGPVVTMTSAQFRDWARGGDHTVPAVQKVLLGALLKYSEDQPRDERGRWTAGGGSSSGGVPELSAADVVPKGLRDAVDKLLAEHAGHSEDRAGTISEEQRTQAREELAASIKGANEDKPGFDKRLQAIADDVGGRALTAPVKGGERLLEKHITENGSDPKNMRDLVRGSIIVNSPAEAAQALDRIKKDYDVTRVKDRFATPLPTGYSDMLINVRLPSGIDGEIQVHIPEMIAAKSLGHKVYDIERSTAPGPEKSSMIGLQSRIFGAARERNKQRTGS